MAGRRQWNDLSWTARLVGYLGVAATLAACVAAGAGASGPGASGNPDLRTSPALASATLPPSPSGASEDATPTASSSVNPSPTPAGTEIASLPVCSISDLAIAVAIVPGRHAAGSTYYPIVLSNTGAGSCRLSGQPTVWFETADGQRTPMTAPDGAQADPVILPPGGAAHADLQVSNAGHYDPAACRAADARVLRVLPPGQQGDVLAPLEVDFTPESQVCLAQSNLWVGAVRPGVQD